MAEALRWFHFTIDCLRSFRKQASWWKTNTPEVDDFEGAVDEDVREELRAILDTLRLGGNDRVSGTKRSADLATDSTEESPKKHKKSPPEAPPPGDYSCPTLSDAQNADIQKCINTLKSKTKTQLMALLKENDQKTSGKKDELVERVAEGMVLGRLPICPTCDKAKIAFNRVTGEYTCPGSFDNGSFQKCSFKSSEVQRGEWVSD
eukprot:Gregarina_sp_Poly_1__7008@NODE_3816_length_870_cov_413_576588_g2457_i0_p1_GENE_NODE_3816_length_870_cov_413_576588_g2457_i0NODE_3816_length_870_cov_413_576588_g2457_i0_p1_ORF_typecomplete_len225_score43_64PADR1/PF08063_12/4_1e02PADR1/PF08063_12/5_7e15SAP/PF02037_27/5_7e03SAP/PF02037_27/3_8e03SAP/PF02037_27/4_3e05TF_Zn_Ribbon/PF08271_12/0_089_NODE_3816_length_870_cov_413_576588_g2457_i0196810